MKVKIIISLVMGLAAFSGMGAEPYVPETGKVYTAMTAQGARDYCDTNPIRDPEGIYLWHERGATVLVRKFHPAFAASGAVAYEIVALESPDILTPPGQVLGYLYPSASPEQYTLWLYTRQDAEGISAPKKMAATYAPIQCTLQFKGKHLKFDLNPLALIPRMRSFAGLSYDDPTSAIPSGLQRIYPAPTPSPGNPSLPYPRYL